MIWPVQIKRVLVVVEGPHDVSCIERVLAPRLLAEVEFAAAGNVGAVMHVSRALAGGARPFVAVRDRDLLTSDQVDALCRQMPNLFVWPGRCLENELLHPPLLASAVRSTAAELDEATVRELMRSLAEEQREEMVADLVERRLREEIVDEPGGPIRRRLPDAADPREELTPSVQLEVRLRDRAEGARRRVDTHARVTQLVRNELAARFEHEHMALINGKRALRQLRAIHPLRTADQLEALLLKHISEGIVVPPGFARLFGRISDLADLG